MTIKALQHAWPQRWSLEHVDKPLISQLPVWISIVLIAMAAWLLVRLVWLLVTGPDVPQTPWASQTSGSSLQSRQVLINGQSTQWTLFSSSGDRQQSARSRLPVEQSNLSLVGVVWIGPATDNEAEQQAVVLIRTNGGAETVYRLGEALPDGRTVEQIDRTAVVLSGPTGRTVLPLQDRTLDGLNASGSATPSPTRPVTNAQSVPTGIGVASLGGLGQPLAARQGAQPGAELIALPVSGGGVRLRPTANAGWFAAAGLQVNDVLLAINGQAVETALRSGNGIEQWVTRVLAGERISLTIRRGGQTLTIEPRLEQLQEAINGIGG